MRSPAGSAIAFACSLEAEHDNLRAALDFLVETESAHSAAIGGSLWRFWVEHGYWTEGQERLVQPLRVAQGDNLAAAGSNQKQTLHGVIPAALESQLGQGLDAVRPTLGDQFAALWRWEQGMSLDQAVSFVTGALFGR